MCYIGSEIDNEDGFGADTQFTEPLTLPHLKHLSSPAINAIMMNSSVENLRLPSLEYLHLPSLKRGAILLCRNVSTTLTTLVVSPMDEKSDHDALSPLCQIPLPKLRNLEIHCDYQIPFLTGALELLDGECSSSKPHYFPALRFVALSCHAIEEPQSVLDLLKEWRVGETFYFHLRLSCSCDNYDLWSPELLEGLKSIVGGRQVEVTWGSRKIYELGVQGGSLRKAIQE
jgi:hypothetical protein